MSFSTGWIVTYIFTALWLWGWIVSIRETDVGQAPFGWFKIRGIVLLFFIWPYVAYCMANQGDL